MRNWQLYKIRESLYTSTMYKLAPIIYIILQSICMVLVLVKIILNGHGTIIYFGCNYSSIYPLCIRDTTYTIPCIQSASIWATEVHLCEKAQNSLDDLQWWNIKCNAKKCSKKMKLQFPVSLTVRNAMYSSSSSSPHVHCIKRQSGPADTQALLKWGICNSLQQHFKDALHSAHFVGQLIESVDYVGWEKGQF